MGHKKKAVEPLSEAVFFILLSIHQEPKHGYAILREVQFLSEDRIHLSTGTLYGAIKRLLERNLIAQVEIHDESQVSSKRPRKLYALTNNGREVLEDEIQRMKTILTTVERINDKQAIS